LTTIIGSEKTQGFNVKAREFANLCGRAGGRMLAADKIAELAQDGYRMD